MSFRAMNTEWIFLDRVFPRKRLIIHEQALEKATFVTSEDTRTFTTKPSASSKTVSHNDWGTARDRVPGKSMESTFSCLIKERRVGEIAC